jgi:uncharacterized protein YgiM (DUF1202 family)
VRKVRILALIVVALVLAIVAVLFFVGYFKPKGAGILVESVPTSNVYIDGEQVGRTPYKETRTPSEITLRLVPDSFDEPLVPYVTKITLVSGVETVVRREFGNTDEVSAGEVLSFERIGGDEASLSVISVPDSSQLAIDNTTRAFTPYKTSALMPGKHTLRVSSSGYSERLIDLKTFKGYKLTAIVQLSLSNLPQEEEEVVVEEEVDEVVVEILVEILSTPTGFLRVRSEPSTLGKEVGQVEPEDQFVLLEEDEETGWYKIEFEEGGEDEEAKIGWISNQYARKIGGEGEEEVESTPTPSPTPSPTEIPEDE